MKLLSRIVAPSELDQEMEQHLRQRLHRTNGQNLFMATLHDHTCKYGPVLLHVVFETFTGGLKIFSDTRRHHIGSHDTIRLRLCRAHS